MRAGLVRLFALIMLVCTPAIAMATVTSTSTQSAAPKAATKAQVAAAKKVVKKKAAPKARYNAPIYASIVIDAATGQVLSEINADTKGYPASLTKMMTLYLMFEALDRGEVRLDTPIPVSQRAANAAPSKLGLTPKSKITVEQAIGALITKSANDVAVASAELLGGTESGFAVKMTERARQMGMTRTTFKNASGLPNPGQLSTARDMSILATRLIKDFPQHYAMFGRMEYIYAGQTIRTHNRLLEYYEGADGIKTGFTSASGFNLVSSATRNGYRVIGVMFGGASASARDRKLAGLMDQGFAVLSGAPETLIAKGGNSLPADNIGTQIALTQSAEATTEEGDRDVPFQPVTRAGSRIETTTLPPPGAAAPVRTAMLTPAPKRTLQAAKMDDFATTYGIQVGAFSSRERAQTQANTAAGALKSTHRGATAVVMGVTVKGRIVYRARVMGLDRAADLVRACSMAVPKASKTGACQAIRPQA